MPMIVKKGVNVIGRRCEKNTLKSELIILSLSPLFLLIGIKNFKFNQSANSAIGFIENNAWILLALMFCLIWIVASAVILFRFKAYSTFSCTEGYTIKFISAEDDAGLNYLLTFILPILFDDLNCWQGTITFITIVILIVTLLSKTNLYYANPILTLLGYKVIRFEFNVPPQNLNGDLIGICPKKIDFAQSIKYKIIDNNVLCIKQREQRENEQRRS